MSEKLEPLVSICCITYNHEKFIRDAIEGFLKQRTDFSFEIIIQDDASTDLTADIIKEYERKYPELVKPIYHKENQYSKGVNPIILPLQMAKGKYVAFCEGDDYWTDPLKLQKQITEMEKHPECHISFHPSIIRGENDNRKDEVISLYSDKNKFFSVEDVIIRDGKFIPTNSIILHRIAIPKIISFFDSAKEAIIGDKYLQILGADNGGALYLPDIMSVYRSSVPNSWSAKIKIDNEMKKKWFISVLISDEKLNKFLNYKHTNSFEILKNKYCSQIIITTSMSPADKEKIIGPYISNINNIDKFLWYTLFRYPTFSNIIGKVFKIFLECKKYFFY